MQETSADISDLKWLRLLRLFCLAILLIPAIVLVICGVLMILNSNAGWLRYPLNPIFLFAYALAALSSPLIGIAALIILAVKRNKFKDETRSEQRRLRNHIFFLGLIDIFIIMVWFTQLPFVFLSAGGSR